MSPPLMGGVAERTVVARKEIPAELPLRQQLRDDLRQQVRARGGKPEEIENITGDCLNQTEVQINDYYNWLEKN